MKLVCLIIVCCFILNSVYTVILHNEIVNQHEVKKSTEPTIGGNTTPNPASIDLEAKSTKNVENSPESPPVTASPEQLQVSSISATEFPETKRLDIEASTVEPPTAVNHHERIFTADELPVSVNEQLKTSSVSSETIVITVESTGTNGDHLQVVTSTASTPEDAKSHAQFAAGVVVNKAEMQSFEEWKEMKLKNSADSDTSTPVATSSNSNGGKQQQGQVPATTQLSQSGSSKEEAIAIQRRKNYASVECGAKVIASNAESAKPSNILSESKDDYMLNSCSDRIWFVIEMCEPIRVTEIELANFELFSNVPRMFKIYASERYLQSTSNGHNWPSKYFVGTFEAMNTRNVQKFLVKHSIENLNRTNLNSNNATNATVELPSTILMYSKYVRFEMLSHYGTEHYCPLSLVRIFGTSIGDEDEVTGDGMEMPSANEDRNVLHTSTALNTNVNSNKPTDKLGASENGQNQTVSQSNSTSANEKNHSRLFEMMKSTFLTNIIDVFLSENFNLSKLFRLFSFNSNGKNSSTKDLGQKQIKLNVENSHIRNQVLQIDLHKALCFSSASYCCQCLPDGTFNSLSKYCDYYFLMITSAQRRSNNSLIYKILHNINSNVTSSSIYSNEELANFTHFSLNNVNYYVLNDWLDNQIKTLNLTGAEFKPVNRSLIMSNSTNESSSSGSSMSSNNTNETRSNDNPTPRGVNLTEEKITLNGNKQIVHELPLDETDVKNTNTTNLNENVSRSEAVDKITPTLSAPIASESEFNQNLNENLAEKQNSSNIETQSSTSTNTNPNTNTNSHIPSVVTPVIIGNGKDAVLMRLSNRVKMLELNMTLSSQYLEKLSQHYRKQMDEMQKAFNLTTTALLETIRVADERDVKQNEKITNIEKKVDKMQNSIESIEIFLNEVKFQTDVIIWTIIIILNVILTVELLRWARGAFAKSKKHTDNNDTNEKVAKKSHTDRHNDDLDNYIENRVKVMVDAYKESLKQELELYKKELEYEFSRRYSSIQPPTMTSNKMITTTTYTAAATLAPHIIADTLTSSPSQMQSQFKPGGNSDDVTASIQPRVAAATIATVVATAVSLAAATAQCNSLNQPNEERSLNS